MAGLQLPSYEDGAKHKPFKLSHASGQVPKSSLHEGTQGHDALHFHAKSSFCSWLSPLTSNAMHKPSYSSGGSHTPLLWSAHNVGQPLMSRGHPPTYANFSTRACTIANAVASKRLDCSSLANSFAISTSASSFNFETASESSPCAAPELIIRSRMSATIAATPSGKAGPGSTAPAVQNAKHIESKVGATKPMIERTNEQLLEPK